MAERPRVASGVGDLDRLLGGLFIGENVIWYDDAGSLATVFCLNFLRASQAENKELVYVTFDRSPKNLLDKLGELTESPYLTVLDCFTCGKGTRSPVFMRFYEEGAPEHRCRIVRVDEPRQVNSFMDALYGIHATLEGDVRFVFESITGMQELWGGEERIQAFYSHSCPRLYELNTVAYWIMEKEAHSQRLRAQNNQIAQVAIELSIRRGTTSLTILKAENRDLGEMHKPHTYWTRGLDVSFDAERRSGGPADIGQRLRELRALRGLSQTELARLVGVTPSTISQVESNLIYPSVPALLKMAEVLLVDVSAFFREKGEAKRRVVFPAAEAVEVKLADVPEHAVTARMLTPADFDGRAEPYFLDILPKANLPCHFFVHKGEELGYLLSGTLQLRVDKGTHTVHAGDLVYLTSSLPSQWRNPGPEVARLLWFKLR
jgi:transcriptional regulator with XRE-family HTH domain/KaiC/GvpD/RAD55 family RecA-like ATPase